MFASMGMLVFGTLLEDYHSIWRAIDSLNLVRVVPRTHVCCAANDRGSVALHVVPVLDW